MNWLMRHQHGVLTITDHKTIEKQNEGLRKLMDLFGAYEELHQLLPDETCHRLLGYINDDFKRSLPELLQLISVPVRSVPPASTDLPLTSSEQRETRASVAAAVSL